MQQKVSTSRNLLLAARCCLKTLVRSVRSEFKQLLVDELKPLGFTGLKLDELTPNRTRRAQVGKKFGHDK